jgi:hypothetical protein
MTAWKRKSWYGVLMAGRSTSFSICGYSGEDGYGSLGGAHDVEVDRGFNDTRLAHGITLGRNVIVEGSSRI